MEVVTVQLQPMSFLPPPSFGHDMPLLNGSSIGTVSPFRRDRKSTRLNSSHPSISYAVFCLKKKKKSKLHPSPHQNLNSLTHPPIHPTYVRTPNILHISRTPPIHLHPHPFHPLFHLLSASPL